MKLPRRQFLHLVVGAAAMPTSLSDLISGQVQVMFVAITSSIEYIKRGGCAR
jgi:hypothetical protein